MFAASEGVVGCRVSEGRIFVGVGAVACLAGREVISLVAGDGRSASTILDGG